MAGPSDRVLVTGSSGFTGKALVRRLQEEGAEVFGYGRYATEPYETAGELTDRDALSALVDHVRPTHVVHLAAISFAPHGDVAEIYQANVAGTAALLSVLAEREPPQAVVVPSSATVYAPPGDDRPLRETDELRPSNHYGASKLAVEHVARLFGDRLPIVVTRPFNYTGPGQPDHFLVPKIVAHFARGEARIRLGNLDLVRDFMDLGTVVDVYLRLLAAAPAGAVLNICSGRPMPLRSVLDALAGIAGRDLSVETDPALVRAGEPPVLVGSKAALEQAIGPIDPPPFEVALAEMYRAARAPAPPQARP